MNNGANFNAIAKQYSASGTAANGGQLGWVMLDQLPDDIQEQVKMTKIGAVSAPLQRDGLIVLIRNEGRRQDGVADPSQDMITLARRFIRCPRTPAMLTSWKLQRSLSVTPHRSIAVTVLWR